MQQTGCLIYLLLVIFSGAPATAQKWTPRYIAITSKTNGYYEYLPEGYDASGKTFYPLILYIHGNSERGNGDSVGLLKIIGGGLPKVMNEPGFPASFTVQHKVFRFVVVAPQFGPRPDVIDVDSVLTYVLGHYPVDLHRIYLTGFSMGGGSCWDYAGSAPVFAKRLAALLPVSGSGTPDTIKTRIIAAANLPVWATHNDSDKTVPVTTTLTYIEYINRSPAPNPLAKKTIFHSTSHNAWAATYKPTFKENGMNVFEWMLQYQRTPAPPAATKQVKVNVYGGSYPDNHITWNNWNVKATLSSGALRYWDATGSSVSATLSQSNGVLDNGTTYGGGMAPAEVLRYTTSGSALRFLTLKGLSPSNTYSLELYASRNASGNSTIFKIGSATQTIATYKNLTNKAVFTNLVPNTSGQIVVSIEKQTSYNHLNGFLLTEYGKVPPNLVPVANAGTDKMITLPTNSVRLSGSGTDSDGKIRSYSWDKIAGPSSYIINNPGSAATTISSLAAGTYTFRLTVMDNGAATDIDNVQVIVYPVPATTSNSENVLNMQNLTTSRGQYRRLKKL